MANGLFDNIYNPDVLSCLANLSNDEVFTPPEMVNRMLDALPQELFCNPDTTFLDPACKTGVFLREIAKRLIVGLEAHFPDLQQRVDHIFHHQLYGIAITELTGLLSRRGVYCSKYPNSAYSVSRFDDAQGNIRYKRLHHTWEDDKCTFCGASRAQYDREDLLETYAYELLHTADASTIFNMKFDVIIGNPPYQMSDGGGTGKSAKAIYQLFVEQAKKLQPRYLSMIIPSRWFSGGKGLDDFRATMLADRRLRKLVDYDNFKEIFPGVDLAGGACYFLWDREYSGPCEVTNVSGGQTNTLVRPLGEYDFFVRSNLSVEIVRKIKALYGEHCLNASVYPRNPFSISGKCKFSVLSGVPCYFTQTIEKKYGRVYVSPEDVTDSFGLLNRWKLLVPKAPIAGQTDFSKPLHIYYEGNTRISRPGEVCSESWLVLGAFDTEEELLAFKSYIFTKVVRFLLLQTMLSQNVTRSNFLFVPDLGTYEGCYTDEMLCEQWGITPEEYAYIEQKICDKGGDNNG